jgi:large subunit ribosomal protein L27e
MRVKPFVRFINYNHIMPTRYNLDVSEKLAKVIPDDSLADAEKAKAVRLEVKKTLEERYKALAGTRVGSSDKVGTGVTYFFRKLRF